MAEMRLCANLKIHIFLHSQAENIIYSLSATNFSNVKIKLSNVKINLSNVKIIFSNVKIFLSNGKIFLSHGKPNKGEKEFIFARLFLFF
jgi:hypothetical protein